MLEERYALRSLRLREEVFLSIPLKAARPLLKRADFAIVALATTAESAPQAQHSSDK